MIPISLLSKMCKYEIEIQGVKVKASVVDRADLVDAHIAELWSYLEKSSVAPLVAFDIRYNVSVGCSGLHAAPTLLILCFGTRCLIVQMWNISLFPKSLEKLWKDQNVCFVGIGAENKVKRLINKYWPSLPSSLNAGVELGHLAARVLKKPNIEGCGLLELASEVGLCYEEPESATFSNWSARVFSKEQVKYAIHDAYATYLIAGNLLKLL